MAKRTIILASIADEAALGLPERLARPDIAVLTPRDLARPGWEYRPGAGPSHLVAAGQPLGSDEITAVVTRLAYISEHELSHIAAADRSYVAAEMGALLVAWLTELQSPVANRPGPTCLCGPFWRHERWIAEAASAGLAVEPARRVVRSSGAQEPDPGLKDAAISITVVGERCLGEADDTLLEGALRLARAAGVETLTVSFTDRTRGALLVAASPWPPLENDAVAQELLDHLAEAAAPTGARR